MAVCTAPALVDPGEPLRVFNHRYNTWMRARLPWFDVRCTARGTGWPWYVIEPRVECPHGCLDLEPYPCLTCGATGWRVRWHAVCDASLNETPEREL